MVSGVLNPALPNEIVRVEVVDPNGIRHHSQSTTDSEGMFEYKQARDIHGNYTVTFTWGGTKEFDAASETTVFRVHRPSWLEMVIKDEADSPVQDAIVRMLSQPLGQASLAAKTDSNGKAVFQGILAGEYSFAVEKTNYEASAVSSQVHEGETSELTVELEKTVSREPSTPDIEGRSRSEDVPLFYGLIPSTLIFVILIGLYIMINGINKGR